MSFSDHKITAFTHRIADLPDQPNLPADELKARFDACPEQLRVSLNAICDDAARLDERVDGIITETFGDTIPKSMLSDELQDEIDAKATQTGLDEVEARVQTLEGAVPQKCEAYFGTYTGEGKNAQYIDVGFAPKAVLVIDTISDTSTTERLNFCGLGLTGNPIDNHIRIVETGFTINIFVENNKCLNKKGQQYAYIAFQ